MQSMWIKKNIKKSYLSQTVGILISVAILISHETVDYCLEVFTSYVGVHLSRGNCSSRNVQPGMSIIE